jgi:hypothetical protein
LKIAFFVASYGTEGTTQDLERSSRGSHVLLQSSWDYSRPSQASATEITSMYR